MKKSKYEILKVIFGVFLCAIVFYNLNAQNKAYNYSDSWGKEGCEIISNDSKSLVINFSINQFSINDKLINGQKMQNIVFKGIFLPNEVGTPNLPIISKFIAIPQGSEPKIKIISYRTEIYKDYNIAPSPEIPLQKNNAPLSYIKNDSIYGLNKFYPSEFISSSLPMQIRNLDCFILGICPFQYNPISKEIKVYRDIKIEITYEGGNENFGNDAYRSRWFDPILEDVIFNCSDLPKIDYDKRYINNIKQTGYEYIIISPSDPDYLQWADSLKKFRTEQGISTTVISLADIPNGNTSDGIETWINDAYNNWEIKPVAILLLGDYGGSVSNSVMSPFYNYDEYRCTSDNIYADIDNDQLPDLIITRIPASNANQLQVMVSKCLNYERTPPSDYLFYNQPITSMGWQTERWFQLCTESISGFFKHNLNKNPTRINTLINGKLISDPWSTASNSTTLINYFGANNLGYIPNTPQELGGFEGGNYSDIIHTVNNGAFMLIHRDHGGVDLWCHPEFKIDEVSKLSNKDLSFIISVDCLTGKYDENNDCLIEQFIKLNDNYDNLGALGAIAATGSSFSFVNDVYLWGVIDNFWPEFLPDYGTGNFNRSIYPAFGNFAGKYFLKQTSWVCKSDYKDITFNLFHMFGDAFQIVYDEVPKKLNVSHNPFLFVGADHFTVSADSGAFIVITANEEIIAKATATGSPLSISIPPQNFQTKIVITVTKNNYIRYRKELETINVNGPYFILTSNSISDPIPYGNNNGCLDYGETNFLNLKIKNIGIEPANNVLVEFSTSDMFVNIGKTQKTISFLPIDSVVYLKNYFDYTIAKNIPDRHKITFIITIKNTTETWTFKINKAVNAPELDAGDAFFSDKLPGGNNNGILETYETTEFFINTSNIGHSDINKLNVILTCTDSNVIIENNSNISNLVINETKKCIFTVKINEDVSTDSIQFNFKVFTPDNNYFVQKDFVKIANIYYEDWETNNFNKMPWIGSGNKNWTIISGNGKFEGYFSAKSGKIKDNEESNLDITFTSAINDTIYFYKKVSSESADYLNFFIDNLKQPLTYWSGTRDKWTLEKFPVKAGTHLYRWQYIKNYRLSGGDDCALIDCIVFPKSANTLRYKQSFENSIQCFPNPFVNTTTISYALEKESEVSIVLFNTIGEKISAIIENERKAKGFHQLQFERKAIPSGLYYLFLKIDSQIITCKFVITDNY